MFGDDGAARAVAWPLLESTLGDLAACLRTNGRKRNREKKKSVDSHDSWCIPNIPNIWRLGALVPLCFDGLFLQG